MNANFGLVLHKKAIELLFLQLKPGIRCWGDEVFEVEGGNYVFPALRGIGFSIFPLTMFVKKHLNFQFEIEDYNYAWMSGETLEEYEKWVQENDLKTKSRHHFEYGLMKLINDANESAIMFAPEGDRLGEFLDVEVSAVVDLLRLNVKALTESPGFLATVRYC